MIHACASACAALWLHVTKGISAMSSVTCGCRPHQVISCCLGSHPRQWSLEFHPWHWYLPFLGRVPHCTWGQNTQSCWSPQPHERRTQMPWISPIPSTTNVTEQGLAQFSSSASSGAPWLQFKWAVNGWWSKWINVEAVKHWWESHNCNLCT